MWDKILLISTNTYLKVENMPTIGFEIKRKCKVCGKVFVTKTLDSHYCSPKCGKVAWKRKKDAKDKSARLEAIARQIPDIREYISVKEAVAMFGVERNTLYRLIKSGRIPAVNIGTRLIRIKRSDMENLFLTRPESIAEKERPIPKLYSMEPEDCYTITQVCEKYHINDSSVWAHVRKYSIPSRQIGNYVYVPKQEIDNLYKSEIE
jgi:excisionase family DNA binding protein